MVSYVTRHDLARMLDLHCFGEDYILALLSRLSIKCSNVLRCAAASQAAEKVWQSHSALASQGGPMQLWGADLSAACGLRNR